MARFKFSTEEIEAAYIEDHHGARRVALKAMRRDLFGSKKPRTRPSVIAILKRNREAAQAAEELVRVDDVIAKIAQKRKRTTP